MRVPLSAFVLGALMLGCAAEKADPIQIKKKTTNSSNAQSGLAYVLSWDKAEDAASYHIFYQVDTGKALEIDSVLTKNESAARMSFDIDDTNVESWPKKGQKACFYLVAEKASMRSDPSDQACLKF